MKTDAIEKLLARARWRECVSIKKKQGHPNKRQQWINAALKRKSHAEGKGVLLIERDTKILRKYYNRKQKKNFTYPRRRGLPALQRSFILHVSADVQVTSNLEVLDNKFAVCNLYPYRKSCRPDPLYWPWAPKLDEENLGL